MLQFHFALLLECIFVEGVLEVLQAQNAVNWGIVGKQVSMIIWLQGKKYLNILHLQNYILFASPKAPCSTISPPNLACAHNCRKCTEPPYHWLLHCWPLQCHYIQNQSLLQQDHHGMGPGLYTPRADQESRLASFSGLQGSRTNYWSQIIYVFAATHFLGPVFVDLFACKSWAPAPLQYFGNKM